MSTLGRFIAAFQARRDARDGVNAKEGRLVESLGLSPDEVERQSERYRESVRRMADSGRLDELREDLRHGEDIEAVVGSPTLLTIGLGIVWCVEFAGALLLLRALGLPAVHRPLPALALTLALIFLTRATVNATRDPNENTSSVQPPADPAATGNESEKPKAPFRWHAFLLPLAYAILVGAITLSRVMGSDAEDGPIALAWGEAIVMLAITVGPAFVAVFLEEKRAPAAELARRLRTIRRRLRVEERAHESAHKYLHEVDQAHVTWQQERARRGAAYATSYQLAEARERLAREEAPRLDANNNPDPTDSDHEEK